MKNIHAATLAVLNLISCAVAGGVALQTPWDDWWHPLLVIGSSATIVSSIYLWVIERKYEEESKERSLISWAGNILFVVGIGLAIAVLSATGNINL